MKKRWKNILSILMVLTLTLEMSNFSAYAADVEGAEKKVEEAQEQGQELEKQKEIAEQERKAVSEDLEALVKEMEQLSKELQTKQDEIEQKEKELVEAKVKENDQYESMKKRIKFMYEDGSSHFIEILIESEDIGDFLNKAEYVSAISAYDRKMLKEFQAIVEETKKKEEALRAEYDKLSVLQNELIAKQDELNTLLAAKEMQISDLDVKISENESIVKELMKQAENERRKREEEERAELERQRQEQQRQQELQQQQQQEQQNSGGGSYAPSVPDSTVSGGGRFVYPCPGAVVSSGFGYREFDGAFHNGVDFAAPEGTPTYAAESGTVIIAGWSDSAGNWVVINHGDGLVTKYMHHSSIVVSAGQTVSKGQQIGNVGNTGNSFGAHLHFQVEVNSSAVDPFGYL